MKKLITFLALLFAPVLIGCEQEPTAGDKIEDVGEGIGEAVEDVGDGIDEAGENLNDD